MRPAPAKAAETSCGENSACAAPHPHMPQLLLADSPRAIAGEQSTRLIRQSAQRALQRAVSPHDRSRDRRTLRGHLDRGYFADRPYRSPARRGGAAARRAYLTILPLRLAFFKQGAQTF